MDREKVNMKNRIKKIWKNINLYRKEQCVICLTLFCFIISGAFLPATRKQLLSNEIKEELTVESSLSETEEKDDTTNPKKDTDNSMIAESEETEDTPTQTSDETENVESENDNVPDSLAEATSPNVSKPNPDHSGNSSGDDSSASSTGGTGKPPASSGVTDDTPSSSGSAGDTSVPEKVWVPPVYETIHHEAIYETVRVVVCNYCSETFNNVGEFQVHKDANGG